jgi:hypothetical protein
MADVEDPNASPMHHDIVENFDNVHVWIALIMGLAATAVGVVTGILLVNN